MVTCLDKPPGEQVASIQVAMSSVSKSGLDAVKREDIVDDQLGGRGLSGSAPGTPLNLASAPRVGVDKNAKYKCCLCLQPHDSQTTPLGKRGGPAIKRSKGVEESSVDPPKDHKAGEAQSSAAALSESSTPSLSPSPAAANDSCETATTATTAAGLGSLGGSSGAGPSFLNSSASKAGALAGQQGASTVDFPIPAKSQGFVSILGSVMHFECAARAKEKKLLLKIDRVQVAPNENCNSSLFGCRVLRKNMLIMSGLLDACLVRNELFSLESLSDQDASPTTPEMIAQFAGENGASNSSSQPVPIGRVPVTVFRQVLLSGPGKVKEDKIGSTDMADLVAALDNPDAVVDTKEVSIAPASTTGKRSRQNKKQDASAATSLPSTTVPKSNSLAVASPQVKVENVNQSIAEGTGKKKCSGADDKEKDKEKDAETAAPVYRKYVVQTLGHRNANWHAHRLELARLPECVRFLSPVNVLHFFRAQSVSVCPRLTIKEKGVCTPVHEGVNRFRTFCVNHGPGEEEWGAVPFANSQALRDLIGSDVGKVVPSVGMLLRNGIPVMFGVAKPGDTLGIGPGTFFWSITKGKTVLSTWNFLERAVSSFRAAFDARPLNSLALDLGHIELKASARGLATLSNPLLSLIASRLEKALAQEIATRKHVMDTHFKPSPEPRNSVAEHCESCGCECFQSYFYCSTCDSYGPEKVFVPSTPPPAAPTMVNGIPTTTSVPSVNPALQSFQQQHLSSSSLSSSSSVSMPAVASGPSAPTVVSAVSSSSSASALQPQQQQQQQQQQQEQQQTPKRQLDAGNPVAAAPSSSASMTENGANTPPSASSGSIQRSKALFISVNSAETRDSRSASDQSERSSSGGSRMSEESEPRVLPSSAAAAASTVISSAKAINRPVACAPPLTPSSSMRALTVSSPHPTESTGSGTPLASSATSSSGSTPVSSSTDSFVVKREVVSRPISLGGSASAPTVPNASSSSAFGSAASRFTKPSAIFTGSVSNSQGTQPGMSVPNGAMPPGGSSGMHVGAGNGGDTKKCPARRKPRSPVPGWLRLDSRVVVNDSGIMGLVLKSGHGFYTVQLDGSTKTVLKRRNGLSSATAARCNVAFITDELNGELIGSNPHAIAAWRHEQKRKNNLKRDKGDEMMTAERPESSGGSRGSASSADGEDLTNAGPNAVSQVSLADRAVPVIKRVLRARPAVMCEKCWHKHRTENGGHLTLCLEKMTPEQLTKVVTEISNLARARTVSNSPLAVKPPTTIEEMLANVHRMTEMGISLRPFHEMEENKSLFKGPVQHPITCLMEPVYSGSVNRKLAIASAQAERKRTVPSKSQSLNLSGTATKLGPNGLPVNKSKRSKTAPQTGAESKEEGEPVEPGPDGSLNNALPKHMRQPKLLRQPTAEGEPTEDGDPTGAKGKRGANKKKKLAAMTPGSPQTPAMPKKSKKQVASDSPFLLNNGGGDLDQCSIPDSPGWNELFVGDRANLFDMGEDEDPDQQSVSSLTSAANSNEDPIALLTSAPEYGKCLADAADLLDEDDLGLSNMSVTEEALLEDEMPLGNSGSLGNEEPWSEWFNDA